MKIWWFITEIENLLFTEENYSTELSELYLMYLLDNVKDNDEKQIKKIVELWKKQIEFFEQDWKLVVTKWIHLVMAIYFLNTNLLNWNLKLEENNIYENEFSDWFQRLIEEIEWTVVENNWEKIKTFFHYDNDVLIEELDNLEDFENESIYINYYEDLEELKETYFKNYSSISRLKIDDLSEDKRSFFEKLFW